MSIKRYEMKTKYRGHESWDELEEDKEGGYVDYEDYSALEQKLTDMAVQLANAESKYRGLAVENAGLKAAISAVNRTAEECEVNGDELKYVVEPSEFEALTDLLDETPATDAFLAEVRAQGVEMYADNLDSSADDAERDGFDDAVKFLRSESSGVRLFAAQLRKGAGL
ncbi:hypothetical protein [Citrobacter youngae]|uniref:hypothetical protein n=1 Tax=Citrobacter youngae TaxID=133448 RepID=UPI00397A0F56